MKELLKEPSLLNNSNFIGGEGRLDILQSYLTIQMQHISILVNMAHGFGLYMDKFEKTNYINLIGPR